MAIKQRIGRAKVISQPACIFIADEECKIVLYAMSKRMDGDGEVDNPEIVISVDAEPVIPYGDDNTATLPYDKGFPIYLEQDQALWAVSPGESEVTWSVLPVPLAMVGY